jgi:hypothetical protein
MSKKSPAGFTINNSILPIVQHERLTALEILKLFMSKMVEFHKPLPTHLCIVDGFFHIRYDQMEVGKSARSALACLWFNPCAFFGHIDMFEGALAQIKRKKTVINPSLIQCSMSYLYAFQFDHEK